MYWLWVIVNDILLPLADTGFFVKYIVPSAWTWSSKIRLFSSFSINLLSIICFWKSDFCAVYRASVLTQLQWFSCSSCPVSLLLRKCLWWEQISRTGDMWILQFVWNTFWQHKTFSFFRIRCLLIISCYILSTVNWMLCGLTNLELSLIIIFLAKSMHSFQQLNVFVQQLELKLFLQHLLPFCP